MIEQKSNWNIASKKTLQHIINSFNNKQTFVFVALFAVMLVSSISMLERINKKFLTYIPQSGGSIREGVIGTPRFINPILAISDTDRDLSSLIYSGLMKKTPTGTFETDLAESYQVSTDGLTYTFTIKPTAVFQDKTPLSADDVIFTVDKIKDSLVKSPLQALWQGVNVSKGETSNIVIFSLSQPYASFMDNLTLGILPKHIWDKLTPEEFNFANINLEAIGAGPYKIKSIKEKSGGGIEEIRLSAFHEYVGKKPFIEHITFEFFKNDEESIRAYRKGRVDQISAISPQSARELSKEGYRPTTASLSRIFGIFLNPNHNEIFRNKNVVKAIDMGIDKNKIISEVLYGFGQVIDSPVPKSLSGGAAVQYVRNLDEAKNILEKEGWKLNPQTNVRQKDGKNLAFSISTADVSELRTAAEIIKSDLGELGISVTIKVFDVGMLNQTIIRPRDYESVLFGQVVRNESDLFAFWHSSQRNDPGLNIAVYTNNQVDKTLEDLIGLSDEAARKAKLASFEAEIAKDEPAIFLYSPQFVYMESDDIHGIKLNHLSTSSDRFLGIEDWYVREDAVYSFLLKNKTN